MVLENIKALLIYKCKRWGPPAARVLVFSAKADPEMTVLRLALFSQSSEECGTWPLTKEFASLGPPALIAIGQLPVNPEQSRINTPQLYLLWRPLQTYSSTPWRGWDSAFACEERDLNLTLSLQTLVITLPARRQVHKLTSLPQFLLRSWWVLGGTGHTAGAAKALTQKKLIQLIPR